MKGGAAHLKRPAEVREVISVFELIVLAGGGFVALLSVENSPALASFIFSAPRVRTWARTFVNWMRHLIGRFRSGMGSSEKSSQTAVISSEDELVNDQEALTVFQRLTDVALWEGGCKWDRQWTYLAPWVPDAGARQNWDALIHPHDRSRAVATMEAALLSAEEIWSCEYRVRSKSGEYLDVLDRAVISRNADGSPERMHGVLMNMSAQKEAERAVRLLSERVVEAQEEERSRVARELHDSVSQILSAAKFRAELIQEGLSKRQDSLEAEAGRVSELIWRALREVKVISRNLRPSELDELGLFTALQSACEEFRRRTGINVSMVESDFPKALTPQAELAIYRIVQEALTNVEKHAEATEVTLRLARADGCLSVVVRDNGQGLGERDLLHSGRGLANIRERAAFIGGSATIRSTGEGTSVDVRIPWTPMQEERVA